MKKLYYVFSTEFGSFAAEAKYAKDIGLYLFYDEQQDVFLNKDGNKIDITGMDLLPRTGVLQAERLVDAIYSHGGHSTWVQQGDYEKVLNWPNYINTKRTNVIMSGKEILENPNKIIELFGYGHVFFKTKHKNYSQIIDIEKLISKDGNFYKVLQEHENDDFILSDVVDILEDDYGMREYRCYVVDGKPLNISRVHDYLVGTVSSKLEDKVIEIMDSLKDTDFPRYVVIDLFEYKDNNGEICLDVLECNPLIASGTYLYNSIFGRKGALNHMPTDGSLDPYKTIPEEKMKYGPVELYSTDSKFRGRASVCYELPGGFAADLITFAMFGKNSNGMFLHFDTRNNMDPSNVSKVENSTLLNSDKDYYRKDNQMIADLLEKLIESKNITSESKADDYTLKKKK